MSKIIKILSILALFISGASYADIKFWTTEVQPARMEKQMEMAKSFEAKTGIKVEVIPIEEKDLGTRATAAAAAGDLPDVIYHTLQYVLPWAEAGILDVDANNDVVKALGKKTFAPGALKMAKKGSKIAAVPVDGWTQMVVYRKDLFEQAGLEPPTNYANIEKAIDALSSNDMFGFVAATKTDENFMSQVLEHVLLANGVNIVKKGGTKKQGKALKNSLEFYKKLAKASPSGELYWKQSRELYFAGKTPMIIWSPFIMDELAGLRDSAPPTINSDPTSPELASKTGFITNFSGPNNKKGAAWADIRYFGITADADTDEAKKFVMYSMDEGYTSTLSIAPEGKFPVRRGNSSDPEAYTKAWSKLPVGVDRKAPLTDLYSADVINNIVAGLDTANRWGVKEGELSRASKIINAQFINRIAREYMDDQISVDEAVDKINAELAKFKQFKLLKKADNIFYPLFFMEQKLSKTEKRTAYILTLPAVCLVFAIILFPIFANIWISFKEVQLKDIRIPEPRAKEIIKILPDEQNKIKILYKLRNSSLLQEIRNVEFQDKFPKNFKPLELDDRCQFKKNKVKCDFGNWPAKYKENFEIVFSIGDSTKINKNDLKASKPKLKGDSDNILLNTNFTFKNFKKVIFENEFTDLLLTTFYYTFFGTVGSIIFGILTAQMVNQKFYGRTFMRSILLFPYVAPVVALAYTWELLLDPNSGTLNSLLVNFQVLEAPINLLGQKYLDINILGFSFKLRLALTTVIIFEIWRYFPLAFLFILARLQAIPKDLYEAADVDGASPFQKFFKITLPQITAVISILFMIRFIWNFNKFEDVFLLTGGASGTRTLPINVYQQGFAISDIGMGSAVSIVIVILLLLFMFVYFKALGKRVDEN